MQVQSRRLVQSQANMMRAILFCSTLLLFAVDFVSYETGRRVMLSGRTSGSL